MSEPVASTESAAGNPSSLAHPFPEAIYQNQGLDQLVVFCISRILDAGEECTFERLVYECFTLFPRKFGMERYPQWPDSARVNKSWLRCRTDRRWISGSVQSGFVMTPAGTHVAESVATALRSTVRAPHSRQRVARERWEAVIGRMKRHPAFVKFKEGKASQLTQQEVRNVLSATLETPMRILAANLSYFSQVASEYRDEEVQRFLGACKLTLGLHESVGTNKTADVRKEQV